MNQINQDDIYSEMPQIPSLPNNIDDELPLFYRRDVPSELIRVQKILSDNMYRKRFYVPGFDFFV